MLAIEFSRETEAETGSLSLGLGLGLGLSLGLMEHDDQALVVPAFTLTAVPLTSTSRDGGLCRS